MERKTAAQYFNDYDFQSLITENCSRDKSVYHYMTINTLMEILSNKKLRFSNRLYLNDYSEGKYVLDLCINQIDEIWSNTQKYQKEKFLKELRILSEHINNKAFHIYQASFSLSDDSLTMWNYYAKGDGANMKFSLYALEESYKERFLDDVQWPVGFLHAPVIYDMTQQIEILNKLLADFATSDSNFNEWYMFVAWAVLYVGTFFKHESFQDEREYRIAYSLFFAQEQCLTLRSNEEGKPYFVNVYQRENMLVPYIDIDFDIKAIEGITLSPRLETENISDGLQIALRQNGFDINKIHISKSKIPVRF